MKLIGWVRGSKMDKKSLGVTINCRHKPIKPPYESQIAPQNEGNVWEKLNIKSGHIHFTDMPIWLAFHVNIYGQSEK